MMDRGKLFKKLSTYNVYIKNFFKKNIFNLKSTYCHDLWDSVYINRIGDIYSCCWQKPAILGNVYRQTLGDIWRGNLKLKFFRWMSLHGYLDVLCWWNCRRMSSEVAPVTTRQSSAKYPKTLHIFFSELCNLDCLMCHLAHRDKTTINIDILKKNIEYDKIEEIIFQGGEFFCMKAVMEFYLWLTKEKNKKVNLMTNGTLINDEWADNLVKGSNWVMISVNAATKYVHERINRGSDFDIVINNIKRLIKYKLSNQSNCQICFKFTIVKENWHEIPAALLLAYELGCDQILYGHDLLVRPVIKNNAALRNEIKDKLRSLLRDQKFTGFADTGDLELLGLL